MWITGAFSAIGLTGVEFVVWFLLGLLRERALSVYHWMFLVRGGCGNPQQRPVLSDIYFHEDCGASEGEYNDHNVQFFGERVMRKSLFQVLLLSLLIALPAAWARAQSSADASTSSPNTKSTAADQAERREMTQALRALQAEVERLRPRVGRQ